MSNKEISGLPETGINRIPAALEFDPERYRAELAALELTEAQEAELLETLWDIMRRFVELGCDVNLCGQIFEGFNSAAEHGDDPLDSKGPNETETPAAETQKGSPS